MSVAPTAQRIADAAAREVVTLAGRVVALQVEPHDAAPQLTARIDDGTGRIDAVFMGRRVIPGIEAGVQLTIEGRISDADARPRIYNPRYWLS
ncbi:OB-fold nucleic acid binding domain-containing protein [Demequina sp. NBRC 110057]|uniref:OB-fold nucleic acid binding domain-containing protein n=1 Tax=Demequina sp. NBRC 110057 TaxID=1570346 RepID=UPI000A05F265|nr:OB-fold nucleic acid binding domain-containing protein [Demequina sp. NBRC 110057]